MKNPKLIEGLTMLEKEEWISFRKYILMYCTKSSDNYKLLDYLFSVRKSIGIIESLNEIKQPLFEKMPTKNFSNLMSKIYLWFEEWVVWHEGKKDKTTSDIQLVKIFNRKGLFNLANKTYRKAEQRILKESGLDLRKHKDLYQLHHNHYYSDNPVKYKRQGEILETLISYFLLQFKEQSLLYITELYNWGDIQNHDYTKEIELLTQLHSLIQDSKQSELIQFIIKMVSNLDKKAFLAVRDMVYSDQINRDSELYVLASLYLSGYSMKLWKANKIKDPQLVLDVYDFVLESGVMFRTGKIPFVRFLNLISALGFIKTSKRTYDFVDKWNHMVDAPNAEAVRALSYAQLKYIEKKYEDIVPLLVGIKFSTDWGRLRASSLELISLYSDRQRNYNLLMNRLSNFKRVLKTYSGKGSKEVYRSYLNFIKVMDLLVKRDFIKITIDIEKYSPITYKSWLISEIKAGHR